MAVAGSNDYLALRFTPKFIEGLQLARASNTTATIQPGSARDSSDEQNIALSAVTTLNFSVVGLNGIDTGVIEASKLYYVYVIYG